ncbi:MAG TPA: secondary thiamine-phosphate synthase enzyme YjbQ [Bacteroidales bacterium]|nr:secondary thiamine-phosphate synthase enzyme YjbQ [Bacteroidales bacterium]
MVEQFELKLPVFHRGYHIITALVEAQMPACPEKGVVNIFLHHTSAALTINENADPTVREDFESFINKLVPEKDHSYRHAFEGPDDMPAHLKSSLLSQSVTIPISNGRLKLGTWQGIYLCEFRSHAAGRRITITIIS